MVDDPFVDVITAAVAALEEADITYAITGSIASGVHGEPLPSQNVDIAIRMTPDQAQILADKLPQRFYRSAEHLIKIAETGGLSNLIDTNTGLKVDLSVLERTSYYDLILARKILVPFSSDGRTFYTVTPEDIVLMKLLWRKDTQSQKQWENALSVGCLETHHL